MEGILSIVVLPLWPVNLSTLKFGDFASSRFATPASRGPLETKVPNCMTNSLDDQDIEALAMLIDMLGKADEENRQVVGYAAEESDSSGANTSGQECLPLKVLGEPMRDLRIWIRESIGMGFMELRDPALQGCRMSGDEHRKTTDSGVANRS